MMGGGTESMMGSAGSSTLGGGLGAFGILGSLAMLLPMLLVWALPILGIVLLVRYFGGYGKRDNTNKTSLDILKERYAKGEISQKEFKQIKKELT